MSTQQEDLLNRLGKQALECRELIREMHEVSRDLKEQIREAKAALSSKAVEEVIEDEVAEQLKDMGEKIGVETHKAYDNVLRQFDRLTKPLLASIKDIHEHIRRFDLEISQRQKIMRGIK